MNCDNINNIINQSDFDCIGQVAKHCDLQKLCVAINEAQEFDLSELFCDFWNEILEINNELKAYEEAYKEYQECLELKEECIEPERPENYEAKVNLICGGSFEVCNGKTGHHSGVKRILVYYAYSRYLPINEFNDTPNGQVAKTNQFSIPKPLKEIQGFADKYRNMGLESCKRTIKFLCANREVFPEFSSKDCGSCKCGNDCSGKTKVKGYGFRGSIISKR